MYMYICTYANTQCSGTCLTQGLQSVWGESSVCLHWPHCWGQTSSGRGRAWRLPSGVRWFWGEEERDGVRRQERGQIKCWAAVYISTCTYSAQCTVWMSTHVHVHDNCNVYNIWSVQGHHVHGIQVEVLVSQMYIHVVQYVPSSIYCTLSFSIPWTHLL